MYKVKETFEYLVENASKFTSVDGILNICNSLPGCIWENTYHPLPVQSEEASHPWGESSIEVTDLSKSILISKADLVSLIRKADKLNSLQSWGVDNWEGYENAMTCLDDSPDEELLRPYLND